ncbi:hypothetical protein OG322_23980 [Streptomyces sp. NBC_01260]|uniref:hypothetical protein n=1 Tax=unclassified Streptomyces TaxID=2593676 RepID=UPI0022513302|nr:MULTISPECIES: hypothetical protein [unclassified Streptomyces]MCX4772359.1 hypothetical protein [Streptomyces sp. NBC_01285]
MIDDDDAWMSWFIRKYDELDDPELQAELLTCHGIHPQVLATERRRLARLSHTTARTESVATPSDPPVRRASRVTRRPTTPRRAGRPRTYQVTRSTRRVRTNGRTVTIVTTTVTVTTVTTVTTTDS